MISGISQLIVNRQMNTYESLLVDKTVSTIDKKVEIILHISALQVFFDICFPKKYIYT